ncbi:DUF1552 domain-containing protein [Lignipirellula cremea]|uniref:DUF1552 domain-containing protein n=1 Tax=Lignipirellula cremea TaxID=2528010 RepID=A0A518E0V0_9BACT|nr:DUF1552 domain-containing protein [Lignipirellula cremea]QDU97720.1 hypothetical protein Pla8534_55740 [Lignipirellula cremea]
MFHRRDLLKSLSVAAGGALLAPIVQQLQAQAAGDASRLPQRFVFVVRANGLRPWGIVPEGLEAHGENRRQQERLEEFSLADRKLHPTFASLEPLKEHVTIINNLSGRAAAVSDPHGANFGALGMYRSAGAAPPAGETIDAALAAALPSVFSHLGFKMGSADDLIAHPHLSAAGRGKPLPFYCSPLLAYKELFGSLARNEELQAASQLDKELLDFMVDDVKRVQQRLAAPEKAKLEHYLQGFESLRDRRVKLATLDDSFRVHIPSITDKFTSPVETHRLEAHFDLAAAALIAGLTNVVTFDADDLEGHYSGLGLGEKTLHGIGHLADDFKVGRDSNFADGTDGIGARNIVRKFQLDLIAGLATKLKAIPEGDGNMLDNTLIVFLSDAGQQHHANYENFPLVLVGNVGGKFKTGRFLNYPSYQQPGNRTLGSFYLSLLAAARHERESFGELDLKLPTGLQQEPLPELFV